MKKMILTEVELDTLPIGQLIYSEDTKQIIKLIDDTGLTPLITLDEMIKTLPATYEVLFSKGLRLSPKVDNAAIIAIPSPDDFSLVLDLDTGIQYVFDITLTPTTVGLPANAFADVNATGMWYEVKSSGLRGVPVVDVAALQALAPADFEMRQILGDASVIPIREDVTYVFKLGATSGDIADTGTTGFWMEQVPAEKPISFVYIYDDALGATPAVGHVSVDSDDEDAAAFIYLNKENQIGQDLSKYFSLLDVDHSITVMNDVLRNESYKYIITGPAVLTGDVFEVPVTIEAVSSSVNGTIVDTTEVFISIKDEEVVESLRVSPVLDKAALLTIEAKDFMITKMVSENRDYVFTEDATISATNPVPVNSYADAAGVGYWTAQLVEKEFKFLATGVETQLDTLLPYDITSVVLYIDEARQADDLVTISGNVIKYNFPTNRKSKMLLLVK